MVKATSENQKVIVVMCYQNEMPHLFGVFESKEKYLQEVAPHLAQRGIKAPFDWAKIEAGQKTLIAEEVELNHFQDFL
jgi:hypothetical protein